MPSVLLWSFFLTVFSVFIALKRLRDSANANDVETGECAQWDLWADGEGKAVSLLAHPHSLGACSLCLLPDSEVTAKQK